MISNVDIIVILILASNLHMYIYVKIVQKYIYMKLLGYVTVLYIASE